MLQEQADRSDDDTSSWCLPPDIGQSLLVWAEMTRKPEVGETMKPQVERNPKSQNHDNLSSVLQQLTRWYDLPSPNPTNKGWAFTHQLSCFNNFKTSFIPHYYALCWMNRCTWMVPFLIPLNVLFIFTQHSSILEPFTCPLHLARLIRAHRITCLSIGLFSNSALYID